MPDKSILGLTAEEIHSLIGPEEYSLAHALAIANGIYKKGIGSFSELTGVPRRLREKLISVASPGFELPVASERSQDGSIKYLFRGAGDREYEAVYIPDGRRKTVCVSVQSGCRMGCSFCVTASIGFRGNLTAGEILNQVISIPEARQVTNVVFMGMGEPLDNIEEVLKACNILTAEWGMALGSRNVTVSTVGITEAVKSFIERSSCNLTLSLHSPFQGEREKTIPAGRKNNFADILDIMRRHPKRKGRRFSVAYVMIDGVNDTQEHLDALIGLLEGSDIRVNLLPFHSTGKDLLKSSSDERMMYFKHSLIISGISASVRKSRGEDISAACGLLAGKFRGV